MSVHNLLGWDLWCPPLTQGEAEIEQRKELGHVPNLTLVMDHVLEFLVGARLPFPLRTCRSSQLIVS